MSERPVRWLVGGEASEQERALLRSARSAEPPAGAEDRIWAALAPKLPPDGGGSDLGSGGGAEVGAGALGALKSAGIGALAGLLVAGAATFASGPPAAPRAAERSESSAPALPPAPARAIAHEAPAAPAAPETAARPAQRAAPAASVEAAPPPSSVAALADSAETRASQLREESRALQAVRDALRRSDAAGALATLEATRARFPASVLGQEREALTIQALAAGGQRDAASARARAFVAQFPTSPHTPALRRFAEP